MTDPHHETPDAGHAALDEAVGLAFRVLKGLMLVLVALFFLSGVFSVQPHEVAFVSTMGRLDPEPYPAGGHLRFPLVGEVIRVDQRTRKQVHDTFDFVRSEEELLDGKLAPRDGGLAPATDGYLVTGDANLVHGAFTSSVKASRAYEFLTGAADPEALIEVLLERAALRTAAGTRVNSLLGAGQTDFTAAIQARLQESLEAPSVNSGLSVESIELERALVPSPQVEAAFLSVAQASQRGDTIRTRAASQASKDVGEAQTQSARIRSRARSRAERIRLDAEADRQIFAAHLPEWQRDPAGLKQRLLVDALAHSLDKVEEVFLVSEGELRLQIQRDAGARERELEDEAREFTERGY